MLRVSVNVGSNMNVSNQHSVCEFNELANSGLFRKSSLPSLGRNKHKLEAIWFVVTLTYSGPT